MGLFALFFMAASALGGGAAVLWLLQIDRTLAFGDRLIWSFVLGTGVLGWLLFFVALAQAVSGPSLAATCAVCLPGLAALCRSGDRFSVPRPSSLSCLILAGIALALIFDFIEGLSPPVDADTLAYHFAVPKLFLEAHGIFFIPRANDGAVPMLQQLTYMAALGLGGERGMTLWTMLTGWATAAATYSVARQHLAAEWALACCLAFLTVPAVLYGAGSGQVETRNAAYVLLATAAAIRAGRTGDARHAALAGVAAGFYAASKYPGLLFVAACALPLLLPRHRLACGAAYGLALLVAGSQWYAWNAWNTGDPVFPMMFGTLPYSDGVSWNTSHHVFYQTAYRAEEKPLPASLTLLFLYPFYATFSLLPAFESHLVGFGPLGLLLLPPAILGIWFRRHSLRESPVAWMAVVGFASYALWFFFGPSFRVRFHLPLYPIFLICLFTASERAVRAVPQMRSAIGAGLILALLFQTAVHAIFTLGYARYVLSGESRSAFVARNVSHYAGVEWLNANLGPQDRVAIFHRELNYLLEVPYFYVNTLVDPRVGDSFTSEKMEEAWRQLRAQKITHLHVATAPTSQPGSWTIEPGLSDLLQLGCLAIAADLPSQKIASRTLSAGEGIPTRVLVLKLVPDACKLETVQ